MKNLLALLLLFSVTASAQMTLNSDINVSAQRSVDGKQYKLSNGKHVPYATAAEFLTAIPLTRRHVGEIAYITNSTGNIDVWQFTGGIEDFNLKIKKGVNVQYGGQNFISNDSVPSSKAVDSLITTRLAGFSPGTPAIPAPNFVKGYKNAYDVFTPFQADSIPNGTVNKFSQWGNSSVDIYFQSGKVGIGTTAPTTSLDVRGPIRIVTGAPVAGSLWTATDNLGNGNWAAPASATGGYSDAMARGALGYTTNGNSGPATYSTATGLFNFPIYTAAGLATFDSLKIKSLVINIPDASIQSAAAWNAKQPALNGNGFLTFNGTTPSYVPILDSNNVPALHSQTYYDLRYGSLATTQANTATLGSHTTSINTLNTNTATNTTNISSNTTAINGHTTSINGLTTNVATNTSNIAANTTSINTHTTSIAANTSDISTALSSISSLTTTMGTKLNSSTAATTYVPFTGGTLTGALTGLSPALSDSSNQFGTTKYIKQLFATIPKADSAIPAYLQRIDSVYVNGKWVLSIGVDSPKLVTEVRKFISVTGTGVTYDNSTGIITYTGGGGGGGSTLDKVDTLTAQNVRGIKTFLGSTASDAAPQSEQLAATGWTSTGWTGTWAGGWTHTAGNTSVLSHTLAAVSGSVYQINYTVSGGTTGTFDIAFGGFTTTGISATGSTTYKATTTGAFSITPTSALDRTVVVTIKYIGFSAANMIFAASDGTQPAHIRRPIAPNNFGIGLYSLRQNTTGYGNWAFGDYSQQTNTTGYGNNTHGANSFPNTTSGFGNTGIGTNSGNANTTGSYNNYIGHFSGNLSTTAQGNNAIGALSLYNNVLGNFNTAIGNNAGRYLFNNSALTNCNSCLFLGADSKAGADNLSYVSAIGAGAVSLGVSNSMQFGNSSNAVISLTGRVITGSLTDDGTNQLQVTGPAKITGQLNIPNGTLSSSAVNLSQLNTAIAGVTPASTGTFVDTLNNQGISGSKTFRSQVAVPTATLGTSAINLTQLNAALANIVSGTYTASVNNSVNVVSSGSSVSSYMRIGNQVMVWASGAVTANTVGLAEITITLPVSTSVTSQTSVGTVSIKENSGASFVTGEVLVESATTIRLRYRATTTAPATYAITLMYQL